LKSSFNDSIGSINIDKTTVNRHPTPTDTTNTPSTYYSTSTNSTTSTSRTTPAPKLVSIIATNSTTSSILLQPGIYWLQLAVSLPANTASYTKLTGLPYPAAIYTTTTNYPADMLTTDTIQYVASATTVAITSLNTPNTTVNPTQYGGYSTAMD
jgi:hypothetical protein